MKNIDKVWVEFEKIGLKTKLLSLEEEIAEYFSIETNQNEESFFEDMMFALANSNETPGIVVGNNLLFKESLNLPEGYNDILINFFRFIRFDFNYIESQFYIWFEYNNFRTDLKKGKIVLEEIISEEYQSAFGEYKLRKIFESEKAKKALMDFLVEKIIEFNLEVNQNNKTYINFNQKLKEILRVEYYERIDVQIFETD